MLLSAPLIRLSAPSPPAKDRGGRRPSTGNRLPTIYVSLGEIRTSAKEARLPPAGKGPSTINPP